jgi:uncharacterized repeat protein (TIGR03803 family)
MSRQSSTLNRAAELIANSAYRRILNSAIRPRGEAVLVVIFALALVFTPSGRAQTYQMIHRFSGGDDGAAPHAGLTMDAAGRLYGTTSYGGTANHGTVFRLTRAGSGWVLNTIYDFQGGSDGANPDSRVIFGPDGTLYGTTPSGGAHELGTVFNLQPPASVCKTTLCPWRKTIIYSFAGFGGNDGAGPVGDLTFDQAGNLYGVAYQGGQYDDGVVYELTKANGNWTESVLYSFTIFLRNPASGVTLDANGNLYGTVPYANSIGAVYELTRSGNRWTAQDIHDFQQSDGGIPYSGVIVDSAGNLYGGTTSYGANNGGTAYELSPSNGSWSYSVLYNFVGSCCFGGPQANLAFDQSGNLYGTTAGDGAYNLGAIFKLTPGNGGWTYTSLYDFSDQYVAAYPGSNVVFDTSGNLYGTVAGGGAPYYCPQGCGGVWEITP